MGQVIPFKSKRPSSPVPPAEIELLSLLRRNTELAWMDGAAVPGVHRGVVLLKKWLILGVWSHDFRGYTYWPVGEDGGAFRVQTAEEAVRTSIAIVQGAPLPTLSGPH